MYEEVAAYQGDIAQNLLNIIQKASESNQIPSHVNGFSAECLL
jgi:hypothetical protein